MSDIQADQPLFDARAQLVRIDRVIAETRKYVAEHDKLYAGARKYQRERWLMVVAALGSVAAALAAGVTAAKAFGLIGWPTRPQSRAW